MQKTLGRVLQREDFVSNFEFNGQPRTDFFSHKRRCHIISGSQRVLNNPILSSDMQTKIGMQGVENSKVAILQK